MLASAPPGEGHAPLRIALCGDCANSGWPDFSLDCIPGPVREDLDDCDLFVFNLEGPVIPTAMRTRRPWRLLLAEVFMRLAGRYPQPPVLNSPGLLAGLRLGRSRVACLANNHILDGGGPGLGETLRQLRQEGIHATGAGRNAQEAARPVVQEIKGKRLAIANYNLVGLRKGRLFFNIFGAGPFWSGTHYRPRAGVARELEKLKTQADVVIGCFHMGRVLSPRLHPAEERWLADLPLDIAVIHHAHVQQETQAPHVISCGDFVFTTNPHLEEGRGAQYVIAEVGETGVRVMRRHGVMRGGVFVRER